MSDIQQLWNSTAALYERFGLDANSVPPEQRRKYLMEEVGELIAASAVQAIWDDMGRFKQDTASEAADVIVTVLGLCQAHGLTLDELSAAVGRVIAKNDAKTAEHGYALVGGKIRKAQDAGQDAGQTGAAG